MFLKPVFWVLLLLLKAVFTQNKSRYTDERKKYVIAALLTLFIFTQPLIFRTINGLWEYPPTSMYSLQTYDYALVLGGMQEFNTRDVDDRYLAPLAGGRLTTTVELYHLGKVKKIILSSGDSGAFKTLQEPEAPYLRNVLLRMGVPDSVIIVEKESRNTFENIDFCKKIIEKEKKDASILLVTSGFHMRRSLKICLKAGLYCTPFSTDIWTEELTSQPKSYISPDAKFLTYWQHLFREWIGYVAYWIKGYI